MKILYVTDAVAIWGGLERVIIEKSNYLAEHFNYDMGIITTDQGEHPIPFPLGEKVFHRDLGIQFHLKYNYNFFYRFFKSISLKNLFQKKLRACINDINPDVIISVRPTLTSSIIKVKGNIPLVYESHSSYKGHSFVTTDYLTRLRVSFENRCISLAQLVVTLTEGDAAEWRKINPNVCVVPNFVHLNDPSNIATGEEQSIIFVGRFSRQKDIKSLLDIWNIVHNCHPEWKLQIYGGYGNEQNKLLPIINKMDSNIHVYEPTPNIMAKYKENSILVMTSAFEPFGLVLVEAMSSGLPVVAFDCPFGPSDIIADGKDGFLVKDRNIQEFADKVCLLIENKELRKEMGHSGIKASMRYDARLIMPMWKQIFERLSQHSHD